MSVGGVSQIGPAQESKAITGARARPNVRIERAGDDLVLIPRRGPLAFFIGAGGFLLVWWIGWSAGCAFLLGRIINQPNVENVLVAVPFFDGWVFVLLLLCVIFSGRWQVRLGPAGLEERWSVLWLRGRRSYRLDEIKGVSDYARVVDSESGRTEHGVKIETHGTSVRLAVGDDAAERAAIIALLEDQVQRLRATSVTEKPQESAGWMLPSDSEIALHRDWGGLVVVRKYTGRSGAVGGVTFLNFFWNGCVAIFLQQIVKDGLWPFLVFLLPFLVVGAVIMVGWLSALASPWCRRELNFGNGVIGDRTSIFGVGKTKTRDAQELKAVKLRTGSQANKRWVPRRLQDDADERQYAVTLLDSSGADAIVIGELTEGEARCLERVVRSAIEDKGRFVEVPEVGDSALGQSRLWDRWLDVPG